MVVEGRNGNEVGFDGPIGGTIARGLRQAKIPLHMCAIMYVVACKTRKAAQSQIDTCDPHFKLQLTLANPQIIVTFGAAALHKFRHDMVVSKDRGKVFALGPDRIVIPSLHPTVQTGKDKTKGMVWPELVDDLKQARYRFKKGLFAEPCPEVCRICGKTVEVFDRMMVPYCRGHYYEYEPYIPAPTLPGM